MKKLTETSQIQIRSSVVECASHDKTDKLHLNIKDCLKYLITSAFIFTKILYYELVRDAPVVYNSQSIPRLNLPYGSGVRILLNSLFPLHCIRCLKTHSRIERKLWFYCNNNMLFWRINWNKMIVQNEDMVMSWPRITSPKRGQIKRFCLR